MLKISLLALIFICSFGYSQILEVAFFPVYDSMGQVTFIKKSDVKNFKNPKKDTKIFCFNYLTDTLGYWVGDKRKYVSMLPKKK